ncbi:bifunctional nicotinamidase/pyrazinamidase [Legionella nagasakiensis]|uniref:bifunctional nicotinamidase/pyrazinamidase n=1 Tax=Legionella nagasakiensis TaxID=535290 RepID=UPI001054EE80|nr:bifunctional nicotinamidase/pyrazinamidase [Legionella nagasakiensis]
MNALIIIDVQNDFIKDGTLEVPDGHRIIPVINQIQDYFDLVLATQDWHPADHKSFASNHPDKKPFDQIVLHGMKQTLWPDHCVQGTPGAELHPELDSCPIEAIFRKGTDPEIDSYSSFYDNGHRKSTGLAGYLRDKKIDDLYFCGLAADICVYFSIQDALAEGFRCWLIEDAARPLDKDHYQQLKGELLNKGVNFISSQAFR